MSGNDKKNLEADLAAAVVSGIQKRLASAPQLTFAGNAYTPAEVEALLQRLATLRGDVRAAKTAWEARLSEERAEGAALRGLLVAFVAFVRATFGDSPEALADFGLAPRKTRRPLTVEQRVTRAAKVKATREARGTMGKRKKLAITGDVVRVVVTPVTVTENAPR
jgi:hypothetical protein